MVAINPSSEREQRLAAIKRSIAAGTYETSDKLDAALEAFLDSEPEAADSQGLPRQPR